MTDYYDPQKVAEAITAQGVSHDCPACGVGRMGTEAHGFAQITVSRSEEPGPQDRVFPAITRSCSSCGYMQLFNPVALGLIED